MLESVKNAFRMKEIRQKLLYTLAMMVVIRSVLWTRSLAVLS